MKVTDLFFNIIEYYLTEDDSLLTEKVKSIAIEQLNIAKNFFDKFIKLPAFTGFDSDNLLQFVLHWYAAARTIITLHKNITDPYLLDDDSVQEFIKSMGFIFPEYIPATNRPIFLLELANLYKIKGSPQALVKLVQFLNYLDVRLLEYWLVSDDTTISLVYDEEFIYDDMLPRQLMFVGKQVDRMLTDKPLEVKYTFKQFEDKIKDGHWFYNRLQINHINSKIKCGLPSLTPYFGLFNCQYITKWYETYAIISRLVKQEYSKYVNDSVLYQVHSFSMYGKKISLLECMLSLWWCFYVEFGYIDPVTNDINQDKFSTLLTDENKGHLCYVVDIANDLDKAQFEKDYKEVFETRPKTRAELRELIQKYKEKFSHKWNYSILPNPQDIRNLLEHINPDLFTWLYNRYDEGLKPVINDLWSTLDYITGALDLALATFSNTLIFEGEKIYSVINFFKPIYARLVNLAYVLELDNMYNVVIVEDDVHMKVIQYAITKFERSRDFIYDTQDIYDGLQYLIFTDIYNFITQSLSTKIDYNDILNLRVLLYADVGKVLQHDYLFKYVTQQQYQEGMIEFADKELTENLQDFDKGGFFDNYKSTIYYDNVEIQIIPK